MVLISPEPMAGVSRQRADWLAQHILPNEAALRGWLRRGSLSDAMEIDDIIQETYAILAGLERIDHIRNPRTYMFETAKSVVLQGLRRSRIVEIGVFAWTDALEIPCDRPTPEQAAADRQELSRLAQLIGELPPRCRAVFILRKVRGFSQREAARALGLSESTIEKHMIKALHFLSDAIGRGGKTRHHASKGRDHASTDPSETVARDCGRY